MSDAASASAQAGGSNHAGPLRQYYLRGLPPLSRYLDYMDKWSAEVPRAARAQLVDEWRAANVYYHTLEQTEAGSVNETQFQELDPSLAPLAAEVKADSRYRHTFDTMPTSFSMVELDRLIVFQPYISADFADGLRLKLGPNPTPETTFKFALPLREPDAPVTIRKLDGKRYVFLSDSTDFRHHAPVVLEPGQLTNVESYGPIAGVVGLVVGFGSNFLNVIRVGNRALLHNGYHRAFALRSMGITHAPCIMQTVGTRDELEVIAKTSVAEDADFYFESARPPLLKDFFDQHIRKILPVRKAIRMVEVSFEVRDFLCPE